jgi:hypothetical protein
MLADTPLSRASLAPTRVLGIGEIDIRGKKCHQSDVNIHTMTARRLLVSHCLRGELFFYSQLKDRDSNHWIETAFP